MKREREEGTKKEGIGKDFRVRAGRGVNKMKHNTNQPKGMYTLN